MTLKPKWYQSINVKIPIVLIVLLLISLEIIGTFFIRELESQMVATFKDQITIQVNYLNRNIQPILADNDIPDADKTSSINQVIRDFSSPDILEIQILDEKGYILATTDLTGQANLGRRSTDQDANQTLISSRQLTKEYFSEETGNRVYKQIVPYYAGDNSGTLIGMLLIESDIESVYQELSNTVNIFISASLLAIGISIILSLLLSVGITRPIQEMKDQAEHISQGDYSGRLHIYGNDELGVLGETINILSTRVKEANEGVEAERQRLDSVLRHMSDGVIGTDRRGRIVILNNAALDLLNITGEAPLGHSIMDILKLRDLFTFRQLFDVNQEVLIEIPTEESNSILLLEFSTIKRESGFIDGLVCVLSDVTEQEKLDAERRQFVSNVSHELRTPLTSILSYSDALQDGAQESPELRDKFLGVIQEEASRMMRMITDLLNISHMDSGQEKLVMEYVNYTDWLNHVLDRFDMIINSEAMKDRNFQLKREFGNEQIWIEIDQDHYNQVVDNIMNNALKYSPDGGTVTVRLMPLQSSVILSIQDEGLGIPRKDIPHLFDRFYRVDKARSRKQGGTGLGLAIAKEVVQLHNGKIWANSIEGKGSTFFISLPYMTMPDEEEWDIFD